MVELAGALTSQEASGGETWPCLSPGPWWPWGWEWGRGCSGPWWPLDLCGSTARCAHEGRMLGLMLSLHRPEIL